MLRRVVTVFACAACFAAVAFVSPACGKKGGVPTCQGENPSEGNTDECNSCVDSSCSSQVSDVDDKCSDFVSCYEGCQCSDESCIMGCEAKVTQNADCETAAGSFEQCLEANCHDPCTAESGSGTTTSTGSNTTSTGSNTTSTGTSGGNTTVSCNMSASMTCVEYKNVSASVATSYQQECTAGGGQVMDCSGTGLVGCCDIPGSVETDVCYYSGDASGFESACSQSGGTWSTTP